MVSRDVTNEPTPNNKPAFQVPIQFEFEIEVTKSHPHFKIGPLRGMVPANGAAEVRVGFFDHSLERRCSAHLCRVVHEAARRLPWHRKGKRWPPLLPIQASHRSRCAPR